MEIGSVSIGVGYSLDQQAPQRFTAQQGQLAQATNRFESALTSLSATARIAAGALSDSVTPARAFIDAEEELNTLGIQTTRQLNVQIQQLQRLRQEFNGDAAAVAALDDRLAQLRSQLASTTQATGALGGAHRDLNALGIRTSEQIREQVADLRRLRAAHEGDAAAVAQLDGRINALNNQLRTSGGASGQATNAIIQLGRGVEDASFGFIGVANNVPVALEALGRVRTEAQLTGTTLLRSLGNALLGGAGLIFAFQTATFVIISFGDEIVAAFKKGRDFAVASSEDIKRTLEDLLTVSTPEIAFTIRDEDIDEAIRLAEARLTAATSILNDATAALTSGQAQNVPFLGSNLDNQGNRERARLSDEEIVSLQRQRDISGERLSVAEQLLENLRAQKTELELTNRIAEQTRETLGGIAFETGDASIDAPDAPDVALSLNIDPNTTQLQQQATELLRTLNLELPPLQTSSAESAFDRYASRLVQLDRVANAGVLSSTQELSSRIQLLQELFNGLSSEGIDPAAESYAFLRDELVRLTEEQERARASGTSYIDTLSSAAVANLAALGTVRSLAEGFGEVFGEAITGAQTLEDSLGSLDNVLRRVLSRLISAGFAAGIGALTGGGSFGSQFLGQLGIGTPRLASGGLVTSSTVAQIGEAGPEAVLPLSSLDAIIDRSISTGVSGVLSQLRSTQITQPTASQRIDRLMPVTSTVTALQPINNAPGAAITRSNNASIAEGREVNFKFEPVRINNRDLLLLVREAERESSTLFGFS